MAVAFDVKDFSIEFSFDNIQSDFQNFQVLMLYNMPKLLKLIFQKWHAVLYYVIINNLTFSSNR